MTNDWSAEASYPADVTGLTLQLLDLSIAGIRALDSLAGLSIRGGECARSGELSFPSLGLKILHSYSKARSDNFVSYVFLFLQDGTRDWICRLNGKDIYGATYSAFRGRILNGGQDVTDETRSDPERVLSVCTSLERLPRRNENVYVLKGDKHERRIRVEFSESKRAHRIVLN